MNDYVETSAVKNQTSLGHVCLAWAEHVYIVLYSVGDLIALDIENVIVVHIELFQDANIFTSVI